MKSLLKLIICVVVILSASAYADFYTGFHVVPQYNGLTITLTLVSGTTPFLDWLVINPPFLPFTGIEASAINIGDFSSFQIADCTLSGCSNTLCVPLDFSNGQLYSYISSPIFIPEIVIPEPTTVVLFVMGLFVASRNKKHK
ncbi:MAG: hypothetical protein A2Y12_06550 [Planctomycetes bacterium GWF2_42_9]|nr:MAG: hypothetical protein A2Y12_06550 [Planctomycetes bacterium GWF2_42_9]HAL46063.1 hypothetical protein [Phycisphaerales bacterium]